jgi:hypothetical protein
MIVYLAGNFDLLIYPEKEKEIQKHLAGLQVDHNRLVSFFEAHRINGLLKHKKEYEDGKKVGKLIRRN